jgi:hypothetical protein
MPRGHEFSLGALVAWKTVCLPKHERGLGLLDIQVSNNCFIAKHLWNIHLKQDSIWIRWIHHFYLNTTPFGMLMLKGPHRRYGNQSYFSKINLLRYTGDTNKLLI